jgi:predicted ribosome quality control (RQC) complex YloA/Tae2 family protein
MKTFNVNGKTIYFGSNAHDNSDLVNLYRSEYSNGYWFHLSNISSSHGFYLNDEILTKVEKNIIGNILIHLSNKTLPKNQKMIYCKLKNVKTTNKPGLVYTSNTSEISIKKIYNFNLCSYEIK